jgi:hypothetical protein
MIDCSKTMNYFIEKSRMIKQQKDGVCKLDCSDCPLSISNNGTDISCSYFETGYPEEAIAIVQKWSDEHSQKTYLSEFLKNYPNTPLNDDGIPKLFCPYDLGLTSVCPYDLELMSTDDCRTNCIDCWKQPIEESESK